MALADIDHIVVLILENRSFDHMLGYLKRSGVLPKAEGIGDDAWIRDHKITDAGVDYVCTRLDPAIQAISDPGHSAGDVDIQINGRAPGPKMQGFIDSYKRESKPKPKASKAWRVMGFYEADGVPIYDFLARNFAVCDHWFAALPAGTQPNRLMAMGGTSLLSKNKAPLKRQPLVYDWLNARGPNIWCAYQWGQYMPFFALMVKPWLGRILKSINASYAKPNQPFRRYRFFGRDWRGADPLPPVIFLEPEYSDGPHDDPSDDHSPTGVAKGQAMVANIYETLISNPERWKKTMFVITYDEHGGFYDHVEPPAYETRTGDGHVFKTLGVRVPAIVVSPQVKPGSVFPARLDHTSILQLIADKLAGGSYSPEVDARQRDAALGLGRLADILTEPAGTDHRPPLSLELKAAVKRLVDLADMPSGEVHADSAMKQAFDHAAAKAATDFPKELEAAPLRALGTYAKTLPAEQAP